MAVTVRQGAANGVYIRTFYFERAGDANEQHVHTYDHLMLVSHGAVKVEVSGEASEYRAPHIVGVAAHHQHRVVALEDGSVITCFVHVPGVKEIILDDDQIPAGIRRDFFGR